MLFIYCVFHSSWRRANSLPKKVVPQQNTSYLTEYLLKSHRSRKSYETEGVGTLQQMTEAGKCGFETIVFFAQLATLQSHYLAVGSKLNDI
jgi:hypothetical protein